MLLNCCLPELRLNGRFARSIIALLLFVLLPHSLPAQTGSDGLWNAVVVVGKAEVPFRFEVSRQGDQWRGFFFEGDHKIGSTSGTFTGNALRFDYEFLNATLTATFDGTQWNGTYRYNRKNGREYPFHARPFVAQSSDSSDPPQLAGEWEMKLVAEDPNASKDPRSVLSWRLFLRQSGADVNGSILRVDGDTGTLSGCWQGQKLVLSHFAGERPVLLEATLQPGGTLDILLNRQNRYLAARVVEASAKGIPDPVDPSKYTRVTNPSEPFHFRFSDINGHVFSEDDTQFKNKVVILAIGGTWCPNCRDEAPFLVDLYHRFHSRGLEIVGLNFEANGTLEEDKPRIASFVKEFSVPYPILYAGAIGEVNAKLPQIDNFGAYPTSIYLRRDGRVASIHAGFASSATGEEHAKLERNVHELVENLLSEKPN
jgi:thiol-disulfide isomerase/thioredoxin